MWKYAVGRSIRVNQSPCFMKVRRVDRCSVLEGSRCRYWLKLLRMDWEWGNRWSKTPALSALRAGGFPLLT